MRLSQKGQALIESLLALPALILLILVLAGTASVWGLRLHLSFVTEELSACAVSTQPAWLCQNQARTQALRILENWSVHDGQVSSFIKGKEGVLWVQGSWGPFPFVGSIRLRWVLHRPLPFALP